jgi:hypothetical protein
MMMMSRDLVPENQVAAGCDLYGLRLDPLTSLVSPDS